MPRRRVGLRRTLDIHGFELLDRPLARPGLDFYDHQEVVRDYCPDYFAKHAARHGWWWYPAMARDEALLIKQWDSAGGLARSGGTRGDAAPGEGREPCTFSFHTAFKDPATPPDACDRQSIEVRCVLLFD